MNVRHAVSGLAAAALVIPLAQTAGPAVAFARTTRTAKAVMATHSMRGAVADRARIASANVLPSAEISVPSATMSSCPHGVNGLSHVTGEHFLVWACRGTGASADEAAALAIAEPEYEPMTALMGAPLADCLPRPACTAGGGGKISIYLLKPGQTLTRGGRTDGLANNVLGAEIDSATVAGSIHSSGYILLHREMAKADPGLFRSEVVHEFFHVLSGRYNNSDGCLRRQESYWFVEASAKWAQSYKPFLASDLAPATVYAWFAKFQAKPDVSLTDIVHRDPHADFIWPYFMQQETGGGSVIANTWKALADARTCSQMTAAMNSVFSFADHFKDFAVENFDTQLTNPATGKKEWPHAFGPDYPDRMDKRFPELQPQVAEARTFTRPSTVPVPVNVPPLATAYHVINAISPAGALAIDFSPVAHRSDLDIKVLITETSGSSGQHPWKVISIPANSLSVCAYPDSESDVRMFLILANHDTRSTVSGSYTVKAQTACATAASVRLTLTENHIGIGDSNTAFVTVKLNVFLTQCQDCQGLTQDLTRGTGSWSATGSIPGFGLCGGAPGVVSGSGSYTGWGAATGWDYLDVSSYWSEPDPFDAPPGIDSQGQTDPIVVTCPDGTTDSFHNRGFPDPACPWLGNPLETGKWADHKHTIIDLSCTSKRPGTSESTTISGTASATDVILCGAFTANCPIDVPPYPGTSVSSTRRPGPR
jgi:hypothetical protein